MRCNNLLTSLHTFSTYKGNFIPINISLVNLQPAEAWNFHIMEFNCTPPMGRSVFYEWVKIYKFLYPEAVLSTIIEICQDYMGKALTKVGKCFSIYFPKSWNAPFQNRCLSWLLQDGLNSLVDEMKNSHLHLQPQDYHVQAAKHTLLYANRFYVEKVSCATKSKASSGQKPLHKTKFGLLFR